MDLLLINEITIIYAIALHLLLVLAVLGRKIVQPICRKLFTKILLWPVPAWAVRLSLSVCPPVLIRLFNVDPVLLQRHQAGQSVNLSRPACDYLLAALYALCPHLFIDLGVRIVKFLRVRKYVLFCGKSRLTKFLRRNDFVQHWTAQEVVAFLFFFAANTICVFIKFPGLAKGGLRAGRLAVINATILYAGPHLSFLADAIGVPLSSYRHIHSSVSLTTFCLALFHVIVAALDFDYSSHYVIENVFALTAIICLVLQAALFPLLRRFLWYEVALRSHHAVAILLGYAVFRHVSSSQMMYIYAQLGVFLAMLTLQSALVLWRLNFATSLATVKLDQETVRVSLSLPKKRPLKVEAGQYINLWMPLNLETGGYFNLLKPFFLTRSAWQSHPFTVVSWSDKPQCRLELVVKPQKGWTRRLFIISELAELRAARNPQINADFRTIAMFSGPHGTCPSVRGYSNVLVLAQTFGILSCMPFLRKLMHEYGASSVKRVHLVYEAEVLYNGEKSIGYFIDYEFLEKSENFSVSMYVTASYIENNLLKKSERAIAQNGAMPIEEILDAEVRSRRSGGKTLILTSLSPGYQDHLHNLVNGMLGTNIDVIDTMG